MGCEGGLWGSIHSVGRGYNVSVRVYVWVCGWWQDGIWEPLNKYFIVYHRPPSWYGNPSVVVVVWGRGDSGVTSIARGGGDDYDEDEQLHEVDATSSHVPGWGCMLLGVVKDVLLLMMTVNAREEE